MILLSETQTRFGLSVLAFLLATILLIMGLVSGNNQLIKPELLTCRECVWKNSIDSSELVKLLLRGDGTFQLAGFHHDGDRVLIQLNRSKHPLFTSRSASKLSDLRWIRSTFKNYKVPIIVFGYTAKDSLDAATLLKAYGYNAYMLKGGFREFHKRFMVSGIFPKARGDEERIKLIQKEMIYRYLTGNDANLKNIARIKGEKKQR